MKSRFNTVIDLQGKPWLVNPNQVAAITLTGGIVETKKAEPSRFFAHEDVVHIALAGGEKIFCQGFGTGQAAIENCAWQIENGAGQKEGV